MPSSKLLNKCKYEEVKLFQLLSIRCGQGGKGFFVIRYWVKNRPVIRYWGVKNAIVIRYCLKIKSVIRNSTKISYRDPLLC